MAASQAKLATVLKTTQSAMKDMGLRWNPNKGSVLHVKRGVQSKDEDKVKVDEIIVIQCLKQQRHYKFLGVLENFRQEDQVALECDTKV